MTFLNFVSSFWHIEPDPWVSDSAQKFISEFSFWYPHTNLVPKYDNENSDHFLSGIWAIFEVQRIRLIWWLAQCCLMTARASIFYILIRLWTYSIRIWARFCATTTTSQWSCCYACLIRYAAVLFAPSFSSSALWLLLLWFFPLSSLSYYVSYMLCFGCGW